MSLPEVQDTGNLMNEFQGYDQSHEDFMSTCVRCRKSTDAARSLRFKEDLVALSRRFGRCLRVALYPPYTSKQHPIEHRSPRPCSRGMKLRRLFQLIFVIKCSAYF